MRPSPGSAVLSRGLVTSLDLVRGAAAVYVAVHHIVVARGWGTGLGFAFRFGEEAVIVFFLLSGFVIFANEADRIHDWASYYLRRFLRIYPPFLAALLVSASIALLDGTFSRMFDWRDLAGNLLNLQDEPFQKPGVIVEPFMDNEPLWSLSYEVAFYAIFPAVLALWRRSPTIVNHVVGLTSFSLFVLYAARPNHFALVGAYFIIWWTGAIAAAAAMRGNVSLRAIRIPLGWLIGMMMLAAAVVLLKGVRHFGDYPFLMFRHFASALLFLLLAMSPAGSWVAKFAPRIGTPAVFLASISYGIYVFHFPLLVQWRFAWTGTGFCAALGILLALSYLVDRELGRAIRARARRAARIRYRPA
jgi:peptidoglycan/LPS O-acetylase OafA/YrhL